MRANALSVFMGPDPAVDWVDVTVVRDASVGMVDTTFDRDTSGEESLDDVEDGFSEVGGELFVTISPKLAMALESLLSSI